MPQSYAYSKNLKVITDQWSENLGFYCIIEVIPDDEYAKRLKAGDYYIALVELNGDENQPLSFLNSFLSDNLRNTFVITSYSIHYTKLYDDIMTDYILKHVAK